MKYRIRDYDTTFVADTSEELVGLIREATPFVTAASDAEFMEAMAHQIMFLSGASVACGTASEFVADLIAIGFLTETDDEDDKDGDDHDKTKAR